MTILDDIVARKKEAIRRAKRETPLATLKQRIAKRDRPLGLVKALSGDGIKLIAEVKKASPSKGLLCPDFDPVKLAGAYARGGAAAISVLTEEDFFQGSLEHLTAVKAKVRVPVLRKDFVLEPYQVYESAAAGADAILLIVSILEQPRLKELLSLAHSLKLDCLVEVHNEEEVQRALEAGASIIGINNRDLATFKTDIETTHRLRPLISNGAIVVSESGVQTRADVARLKGWGVNAVLVGEALVTCPDIESKIAELVK